MLLIYSDKKRKIEIKIYYEGNPKANKLSKSIHDSIFTIKNVKNMETYNGIRGVEVS